MNSLISLRIPQNHFLSGASLMHGEQCLGSSRVIFIPTSQQRAKPSKFRSLTVEASVDGGRSNGAASFVGGFVLGGIIAGAFSCIYAPQISKVLAGADKKDLMRKLPKFIYDEEKALEKTRKILAAKIEQLNSAIDDISSQLNDDDAPNGIAVNPDELEASI